MSGQSPTMSWCVGLVTVGEENAKTRCIGNSSRRVGVWFVRNRYGGSKSGPVSRCYVLSRLRHLIYWCPIWMRLCCPYEAHHSSQDESVKNASTTCMNVYACDMRAGNE